MCLLPECDRIERNFGGEKIPRRRVPFPPSPKREPFDACSGKDWPRNPIPPNLFSACPKFRNSPGFLGGIRGEESTAGPHQNAKISFNKGKVWKRRREREEETWLERLRAKTVRAPPLQSLVCFRLTLGIWLLSSFRTIARGLRFPRSIIM